MANPFAGMNGGMPGFQGGPMAFLNFMNRMKGQDPNHLLNQLMSSGKVNQQMLDGAQKMKSQIESQLEGLKSMFGF